MSFLRGGREGEGGGKGGGRKGEEVGRGEVREGLEILSRQTPSL